MEKNKLLAVAEKFSRKDLESSSKRKEFAQEVRSTVQELLQSNDQQKILQDLGNMYGLLPASNDAKWILGTIISGLHNARIQEDGSIGTIQADAVLNDSFYGGQGNEELTQAYNAWKDKKTPETSSGDDAELQQRQDRHARIHQKKSEVEEQPSRRQRQKQRFNTSSKMKDNGSSQEELGEKTSRRQRQKNRFNTSKDIKDEPSTNQTSTPEKSSSLGQSKVFPPSNHEEYMPK